MVVAPSRLTGRNRLRAYDHRRAGGDGLRKSTPARRRSHADDHTHWNPRRTRRYRSAPRSHPARFAHGSNIAKCSGWRRAPRWPTKQQRKKPHWPNGAMRYWPSFARCRARASTTRSRLASRYRLADDADIQSIFRLSAAAVSQRQTLERMRALAATQCSADAAIAAVQALDAAPAPALGYGRNLVGHGAAAARFAGGHSRADSTRLETPRHEGEGEHAPHGEHAPRLHPFVIQSLLNEQETGVVPASGA
jgi:hypothetical protein